MPSHPRVHYACLYGDEAQTAGVLFDRDNPRDPAQNNDAQRWKLTERDGSLRELQSNATLDESKFHMARPMDWFFDLSDASPFKRRIPHTSCVNRVSDFSCGLGCRGTAAQLIFWMNFAALVLNVVLCFVIWAFVSLDAKGPDDLHLSIYRIASANYTNSTDPLVLVESGQVQVATWTIIILAIDAALYLLMVLCMPIERWWYYLHRQLDDCFAWWRWVWWSVTDSLTIVLLAMLVGLREQFLLVALGVCTWCCFLEGFQNELWSRPVYFEDKTNYKWRVGNRRDPKDYGTKEVKYVSWDGVTKIKTVPDFDKRRLAPGAPPPTLRGEEWPSKGWGFFGVPDYDNDPMAIRIISEEQWEGDRPLFDYNDPNVPYYDGADVYVFAQRFSNYVRRMLPWSVGLLPGTVPWAIIGIQWHLRQHDLRRDVADVSKNFSEWLTLLVFGAAIIHAFKVLILPIWQKQAPTFYFGSEIYGLFVNAFFKTWVAVFVIVHIVHSDRPTVELALAAWH